MSKKATIGMSPKDRSMDIMDKYIQKQDRKNKHKEHLSGRRKSKDIPIDMWPLEDQLEYWDNISESDKFDRKVGSYINYMETLKDLTGYPDSSFNDMISKASHKDRIRELFDQKVLPKAAFQTLKQEGILWK